MSRQLQLRVIAFFVALLVIDWFLYFRHAGHFFQGDTIFHLNHRATSIAQYLKEFVQLNPSGWYRPLTAELFESLLYPVAGLNPLPYRLPVYALFFAITVAVYFLGLAITGRHVMAAIAAFFFNVHATNAYTTYDIAFMPELGYTFFYVAAGLAYLRHLKTGSKAPYRASLALFIASLLSKESAVTLPGVLFVASLMFAAGPESFKARVLQSARSIVPHAIVLALYLVLALGYLKVENVSVATLFDPSQSPNPGDYVPVLNSGVFTNADLSLSWAFNVPRDWWGQWQNLKPWMTAFLKLFRLLVLALAAAAVVIGSNRRSVIFGIAWFWLALVPALPLVSHFLPYYLFLPVIGLGLVVGSALGWVYDLLERVQPVVAAAVVIALCAGIVTATNRSIRGEIADNSLLGGSSKLASNSLSDLRHLYPSLPDDVTLYFADAGQSLVWQHDLGGLIRMAYGNDRIAALYESNGDRLPPDATNAVVLELRDGRLVDRSKQFRSEPGRYMKFEESGRSLELSANQVIAGADKYSIRIPQAANVQIKVAYAIDDGPLEFFSADLDAEGKAAFDVKSGTRTGFYRFWGYQVAGQKSWIRANQTLAVR